MAGGKRAVFFGILRLLAGGAAAAVLGLIADRLVVERFSTVRNAADDHAQRAALADLGAKGPVRVDGADTRPAGNGARELSRGAGEGGKGHDRFIGRLARMSFTHIAFP